MFHLKQDLPRKECDVLLFSAALCEGREGCPCHSMLKKTRFFLFHGLLSLQLAEKEKIGFQCEPRHFIFRP